MACENRWKGLAEVGSSALARVVAKAMRIIQAAAVVLREFRSAMLRAPILDPKIGAESRKNRPLGPDGAGGSSQASPLPIGRACAGGILKGLRL